MPAQEEEFEEEEEHGCFNCSITCGTENLEWVFEKKDEDYGKNNDVNYDEIISFLSKKLV